MYSHHGKVKQSNNQGISSSEWYLQQSLLPILNLYHPSRECKTQESFQHIPFHFLLNPSLAHSKGQQKHHQILYASISQQRLHQLYEEKLPSEFCSNLS
nr:hypothetical protein Iba_chr03cCG10630 [Ipomoea batatas]